jgi:hypothetical protein
MGAMLVSDSLKERLRVTCLVKARNHACPLVPTRTYKFEQYMIQYCIPFTLIIME